jgi:NAD(P)-dependent dehydrogenase (short-subunit alcohol dehydrogenase family)
MTKVAIVTGGNKGIGLGIAKGLAKVFDGDVFLTARNVERGMAAVRLLEQENITVRFHQLDIDDPKSNAAIAVFMKEEYGGIDILVNNAGIAFKNNATEAIGHQAKVTVATNYFRLISTNNV